MRWPNALYDKDTGAPLNEDAFLEEMEAMDYCCDYGAEHPKKCRWCHQCQQYECPKHQHKEI